MSKTLRGGWKGGEAPPPRGELVHKVETRCLIRVSDRAESSSREPPRQGEALAAEGFPKPAMLTPIPFVRVPARFPPCHRLVPRHGHRVSPEFRVRQIRREREGRQVTRRANPADGTGTRPYASAPARRWGI